MQIPFRQSPNYSVGLGTPKVGYVLHATLGRFKGAQETLCASVRKDSNGNDLGRASAHLLVSETDNEWIELVKVPDVAWHAGKIDKPDEIGKQALQYDGRNNPLNPNQYLLGIEICCGWDSNKNGKVDVSELDMTPWQIEAVAQYLVRNNKEYGVPIDRKRCVGHTNLTSYKSDNMNRHWDKIIDRATSILNVKSGDVCIPKSEVSSMIANKQVLGLFSYIRNLFK